MKIINTLFFVIYGTSIFQMGYKVTVLQFVRSCLQMENRKEPLGSSDELVVCSNEEDSAIDEHTCSLQSTALTLVLLFCLMSSVPNGHVHAGASKDLANHLP